ncbi:Peptidase M24 [Vigna unguiculata]|uniref:Peptidase M24 n=1 Tax=Vigna unguiculata TaxID=3917 RepID=A0A4D6M498_VIGUN|nr:Peptidase M24 [Vigna unguiculata]
MVKKLHQLFICSRGRGAMYRRFGCPTTRIIYICGLSTLKLVILECKPKATIVDICEKGDSYIREQTRNVYKNVKKENEKGFGFPKCISVNNYQL